MTEPETPTPGDPAAEREPTGPASEALPPSTAPAAPRRLTRSRTDRVIAGVCGGLGEYLGVDPVLVRIGAVILVFAGGAGIVLYGIGWLVVPEASSSASPAGDVVRAPATERTAGGVALGVLFVVVGAFFLLDEAFPDVFSWKWMWPVALIVLGFIVLARARR